MPPEREPEAGVSVGGVIQAVTRSATILAAIAERESLRAADVAAELQLDRSTAHRYLTSMEQAGLLERRAVDGSYVAGPLVVRVGAIALQRSRLVEYASPYLADLSADIHETVVLSLWGGTSPVVARVFEDADRLVHVSVREGSRLPLRAAQALVFLAHLSDRALVERLLDELPDLTRRQITDGMERARATGVAENDLVTQGIRAVAAPVFDSLGEVRATVALVGTSESIPAGPESASARALRATADQISHRLGYRDRESVDESGAAEA